MTSEFDGITTDFNGYPIIRKPVHLEGFADKMISARFQQLEKLPEEHKNTKKLKQKIAVAFQKPDLVSNIQKHIKKVDPKGLESGRPLDFDKTKFDPNFGDEMENISHSFMKLL